MTDIMEFLKARLAEDEQTARAALDGEQLLQVDGFGVQYQWVRFTTTTSDFVEGAADPARVLRGVAAKRELVRQYEIEVDRGPAGSRTDFVARHGGVLDAYRASIRILAFTYSDHPDYQQEWRDNTGLSSDVID